MSARSGSKAVKPAYHHGDLRRALTEAAFELVRTHGLQALTLREVARKVGVTHAAPYHHFPSRDALLEALSEEGFEALCTAMEEASSACGRDPVTRLMAVGRAYIDFGRAYPERLQVMFRRQPGPPVQPDPSSPRGRAFVQLFEAVKACQASGQAPPGDTWELSLAAWSIVHGFAKLWVEGPLQTMPAYAERFEAMREATLRGFVGMWRKAEL